MSQSDLESFARSTSSPSAQKLGLAAHPGAPPTAGESCTGSSTFDAGDGLGTSWETAWIDLGGEG